MAAVVENDEDANVQARPHENGERPQGPILGVVGEGGVEAGVEHGSDDQRPDCQIEIWLGKLGDMRLDLYEPIQRASDGLTPRWHYNW